MSEGVFVLGTGSNGVCEAMGAFGGIVFLLMQSAFWGYRMPKGRIYEPPPTAHGGAPRMLERAHPNANRASFARLVASLSGLELRQHDSCTGMT